MSSAYLSQLSVDARQELVANLHESQGGVCFICEREIDLKLHAGKLDIDHIDPLSEEGRDGPENFALTHESCNRSKQAANLRVARVLARFEKIREDCSSSERGPNLADVLSEFGGARFPLVFQVENQSVRFSLQDIGEVAIKEIPLYTDSLSGCRYFYAELPIQYLHHDDVINPRSIGGSLAGLVKEFHKGRPQLHASLAWVDADSGSALVKVFDGQHKAAAQVLLGVKALPVRVFVNPNPDLLMTTNFNAGTVLRQVAFDKSVQRRLGQTLFTDRLERYRTEKGLSDTDESMSERQLVQYFKGESREVKRYAIDAVRAAITHHVDNKLTPYIEFGGKATEKPFSYSTIEKTFLSLFVYPDVLETPLNYLAEEGKNPRTLEVDQVVRLMSIISEELLIGQFEMEIGTAKVENKVQKGENIPEGHLRAYRMCKEEVAAAWLRLVQQIVNLHFTLDGKAYAQDRAFQYVFPDQLWITLRVFLRNLRGLPMWVNRELSATVFGGKQNRDYWRVIFETGKAPQGAQVLAGPIDLHAMIKPEVSFS